MKYKLIELDIWDCGQRKDAQGRPHQEDSIYPAYGKGVFSDRLFILCDGMGGHAAGEVASATVCEAMSESIMKQQPDPEGEFTDAMLLKAIDDAYKALDSKDSDTQGKKMGTTLTFLKLHAGGATIAHMGDSRVYHIRPGQDAASTKILFATRDHSLVNDLVRAGELTEEEARHSRQKNIITRAMQPNSNPRHKADIYHTVDIKPGDYFYLCSDGMLEEMSDENLRFNFSAMTGDDENKRNVLTVATSQNKDNHSAIIVHILDVIDPLPIPPTVTETKPIIAELEDTEINTNVGMNTQIPAIPGAGAPVQAGYQQPAPMQVPQPVQQRSAEIFAPSSDNAPAQPSVQPMQPANHANSSGDRSRKMLLIIIIAAAIVTIGAIAAWMILSKSEPKKESRESTEKVDEPKDDPGNERPIRNVNDPKKNQGKPNEQGQGQEQGQEGGQGQGGGSNPTTPQQNTKTVNRILGTESSQGGERESEQNTQVLNGEIRDAIGH